MSFIKMFPPTADKETIIAGFLHDSINNQKTTLEEIENKTVYNLETSFNLI